MAKQFFPKGPICQGKTPPCVGHGVTFIHLYTSIQGS